MAQRRKKDVLSAQARKEIGIRTKRALAAKKGKNERYSRHVAYGLRVDATGHLVPDPYEQEVLRRMKAMRRRGKNYYEIAAFLTSKFKPRKGTTAWFPASIRRILRAAGVRGKRVRLPLTSHAGAQARERSSDSLVPAAPGDRIRPIIGVDRGSSDYAQGAFARVEGQARDVAKSLNWLVGWDEAPV